MLLPSLSRSTRLACLTLLVLMTGSVSPAPAAATERQATGAAPRWQWPIAAPRVIVRPFLAPQTAYGAGHRGIDLAASAGTPVYAPADGVISFSGTVVDRAVLSIDHGGAVVSSFEPVSSPLVAGSAVHRGQTIGVVGFGGHCEAACLHFGVRLHGQYVSPLNYLGGIPPPVLLPTRRLPPLTP